MTTSRLLAILLVALALTACGRSTRPRLDDDLAVHVVLERREVRRQADRKQIGLDVANSLFEIEVNPFTQPGEFLGSLMMAPILWPFVATIEVAVKSAGRTRVWVTPQDHQRYRQRLSWGQNTIFVPRSLAGQRHTFVFVCRGNYRGVWMTDIFIPDPDHGTASEPSGNDAFIKDEDEDAVAP